MAHTNELGRLEQFVDNLLAKYKTLQERYGALQEKLENSELECDRLKETIDELRSERSEVGSRISGLIDRIEKWEDEQEAGVAVAGEQGDEEGVQGSLFGQESTAAQS